jgi:hypothetical protein
LNGKSGKEDRKENKETGQLEKKYPTWKQDSEVADL